MQNINNESNKSSGLRDSLIIVVVLLAAALGYFIFTDKPGMAQQDHQHADMTQSHNLEPDYEAMIAELPDDYNALIQQGNSYMDARVYPVAVEAYSRALAIDSSNVNVMVDLGACKHSMGDLHGAMDMFRKAVRTDPNHAIAQFNLGIGYLSFDSTKQAAEAWRKYLQLEPDSPMKDTVESLIERLEQQGI